MTAASSAEPSTRRCCALPDSIRPYSCSTACPARYAAWCAACTCVGDGEAKLVRCSFGAIFDVVVDLRPTSPTYRSWESFELRDDEQVTLYVPASCAHGFQALTDTAEVSYMIDRAHDPSEDVSIAFDDPVLAIPWPLPVTIMSSPDRLAPPLADAARLMAYRDTASSV